MRHCCYHCHAATDFISTKSTKCTQCAPDTDLSDGAQWVHVQTIAGQIADRRAMEQIARKLKEKGA